MKALSIRQPWAWLIVNGHKKVENRTWRTNFRGEFAVHAASKMTVIEYARAQGVAARAGIRLPQIDMIERGGIVGLANITDCRPVDPKGEKDPFFFGPYGFIIDRAVAIPFYPMLGKLGFFETEAMTATRTPKEQTK